MLSSTMNRAVLRYFDWAFTVAEVVTFIIIDFLIEIFIDFLVNDSITWVLIRVNILLTIRVNRWNMAFGRSRVTEYLVLGFMTLADLPVLRQQISWKTQMTLLTLYLSIRTHFNMFIQLTNSLHFAA